MQSYTLLEFESLGSTNDFLKENHSYFPHMTFIRADHQEKGRGQHDRLWSSKPNENITCSVLLKDIDILKMPQIKAWIVDGLLAFLNEQGVNARFKEPNDLYVNDKKIAGILIETQSLEETFDYIIIGIGLNVNQTDFEGLNATSVAMETEPVESVTSFFRTLMSFLLTLYPRYLL